MLTEYFISALFNNYKFPNLFYTYKMHKISRFLFVEYSNFPYLLTIFKLFLKIVYCTSLNKIKYIDKFIFDLYRLQMFLKNIKSMFSNF